jgi:hypothetical protein
VRATRLLSQRDAATVRLAPRVGSRLRYPPDRIAPIIDGRYILGARGSRTMPVWGEGLTRLEIGNPRRGVRRTSSSTGSLTTSGSCGSLHRLERMRMK